jgi:hypothetical protein
VTSWEISEVFVVDVPSCSKTGSFESTYSRRLLSGGVAKAKLETVKNESKAVNLILYPEYFEGF